MAIDPLQPPPKAYLLAQRIIPHQSNVLTWDLEWLEIVYGPQNAPMLWQCIITIIEEHFEGHRPSPSRKKNISACSG
jgi:hypothetical protein